MACDVLASLLLVHGRPPSAQTSAVHAIRTPAKTTDRKKKKSVNPLTPGAFCQNAFFGHFGDFQPGYEPN